MTQISYFFVSFAISLNILSGRGFPVKIVLFFGKKALEEGHDIHIFVANCEINLFAKPISSVCSWITIGIPNSFPARQIGTDKYPPKPTIISGLCFFNNDTA